MVLLLDDFFLFLSQAEREMERRKDEIEADDSVQTKEIINKANERVLAYGESIIQESRGIRPTYPIEKAIEVIF